MRMHTLSYACMRMHTLRYANTSAFMCVYVQLIRSIRCKLSCAHGKLHALMHSLTHSLTQSLGHSVTQSLTHSLIHSLASFNRCNLSCVHGRVHYNTMHMQFVPWDLSGLMGSCAHSLSHVSLGGGGSTSNVMHSHNTMRCKYNSFHGMCHGKLHSPILSIHSMSLYLCS